ncbi:ANR26-like protein, partial [Mya arenaria]
KGKSGSKTSLAEGSLSGHGYDVKEKDLSKIHKSAWTGDLAKVKQFAKKDPNALDKENRTALHLACVQGHARVVQELLEWNVKTNIGDSHAQTPLMKMAEYYFIRTYCFLNIKSITKSALHHACTEDAINHVKLLLHYKANTGLKDSKGWTAEDCAMMKAHHGCCQVIFDHNLKSRPRLGSSLPATPRGGPGTATPMNEDSDDPTLSKHSAQDGRQDSWNEDTDISSAMDDHKLKGNQPKVSLTAKVKLSDDDEDYDDDDDELQGQEDKRPGGLARPQYSRTPTPDADFRQSPNVKSNSKIPIKKQMSGASVEDEIFEDDDEDEEEVSAHRNSRVSFSNKQDIRNISATDEDDTDIDEDEEDEEEIVPSKKPKMSSPDEDYGEGYVPTGVDNNNSSTPNKLSQEQFQAMMKDIGLDDVSDEDESAWDSTHYSESDKQGNHSLEAEDEVDHIREGVTSFSTRGPPLPSPQPPSGSPPPASQETQTTSGSTSEKKTVVAQEIVAKAKQQEESEDSDWDSEADVQTDDEEVQVVEEDNQSPPVMGAPISSPVVKAFDSPVVGMESLDNTPRTPRDGGTTSNVTDDESISEWEIERQKEREDAKRAEEEALYLATIEEEEARQRAWEDEERRRQRQMEEEAQAELEREKSQEYSEESDFSEGDNALPDDEQQPQESDQSQQASLPSQRSDNSGPHSITSPRALGEIENESPAPGGMMSPGIEESPLEPEHKPGLYMAPPMGHAQQNKGMYEDSDDEVDDISEEEIKETPADVEFPENGKNPSQQAPAYQEFQMDSQQRNFHTDVAQRGGFPMRETSDMEEEEEEEEIDDVLEATVLPAQETVLKADTEPPSTITTTPVSLQNGSPHLGPPPPIPASFPPAMSLQSDGRSAEEEDLDDLVAPTQTKSIDNLKYHKSVLEQGKLDLEAKIRQLEYTVSDEEEKKRNAELLLKKTKDQLTKKEDQYTQEMELRQRAELSMRNVQMELRSAQNQMKDLEDEKAELERHLSNEKSARELQERINEEQQRLQQHMHEESLLNTSQRDDAQTALELADNDLKHNKDMLDKYKNEIAALKAELQRQRSRLTEENSQLSGENEALQARLEDLRAELHNHEEALTQITLQQNIAQDKLVKENKLLNNSLDQERLAREKNDDELDSIRTRLQSTTVQLEKAQQARTKEKMQNYMHGINSMETKLNSVENEEQNAKLQAKIESFQDRLTGLQHENLTLKQQVDTAQVMASDRAGHDIQDKLNTMIASLKADHEKMRASLEEKNQNLQDTISRLRDEAREQLEQERLALKMEIEKLQAKYNTAQEKTIEAQTRMGELVDRLDRTEQSRMLSSQQLADTSVTMQDFNKSKVENVRNEAELKHEKQKTEMLQRDLADSQKVRSSLEALCSNLKSTNAHLEEKLGGEIANRNAVTKEAEEHKGLWEQEVLSRSKLGLRIAQLDRHKQETSTQLEEEKRRTRKALQEKKLAETKLESEQEKSQGLQKEVANLKAYLKVAKKRLKS